MVQKVIDVVGVSSESFAAAASDAVREAAKSVRNMKWARVSEMEMALEGDRIVEYRATLRIYFDVERS
jgi:flavin-binding protein dodecin